MKGNNNLIKLSADGRVTVHEFPSGSFSQQNDEFCRLIGEECYIYEHICPERLYSVFRCQRDVDEKVPGRAVSMLADEEFTLKKEKPLEVNAIASWLYGFDIHNCPILGDVLFVGEKIDEEGDLVFCGLDEHVGLALLANLITATSKFREVDREGVFIR